MISTGRSIDYKCLMTLYEFLLFIHISATVVWVGAGLCSLVLAIGYDRDGDEPAIRRFLADQERLATRLFIPASLTVVLFLVIADMVIKPTGDDASVLIGMAVILIAGIVFILSRLRALDAERETPAPSAA